MKTKQTNYQVPFRWSLIGTLFLILVSIQELRAQGNISLIWDVEAGCKAYDYDRDKSIFLEQISSTNCLVVCERQIVNYELVGNTGTIENVTWNVSGGLIINQSLLNCQVQWGVSGVGILSFTIVFEDGTSLEKEVCVEKINSPKALFTVFPFADLEGYVGCFDQAITFTNQSFSTDGSALTYYWDFGDGTTSQEVSPVHSYTLGDRFYVVTLTVTNECGCKDKMAIEVKIRGRGFDISCPSVVCEGSRATYSVPINPKDRCQGDQFWTITGGTQLSTSNTFHEVEVVWDHVDSSGFGYIVFDGTSCDIRCPSINSIRVPVIKSKGDIIGETLICAGKQYRYTLPQWPTTEFNWTTTGANHQFIPTDQRNEIIISATDSGTITLECQYFNTLLNCGGSARIEIQVKKPATISGEVNICQGKTGNYTLTDSSGNLLNGNWTLSGPEGIVITDFGSTFTYEFEESGTYTLTANGEDFCAPDYITITVVSVPSTPLGIGVIGDRLVCPGIPVNYFISSPNSNLVYEWSIDSSYGYIQGSNVGNQVTVIFLPTASVYVLQVRAIQKDAPHCPSKRTNIRIDKIQPVFDIESNQGTVLCASSTATYFTSYTTGDVYNWRIEPAEAGSIIDGNGTTTVEVLWNSYVGVPARVYLDVTQCGSVTTQNTEAITIVSSPTITINAPAVVCKGQTFIPTINAVDMPISSISSIVWSFGDGEIYTVTPNVDGSFPLTATYAYNMDITNNTDYTITAVVYGPNGCYAPSTATFVISVKPSPNVSVTPNAAIFYCEEDDIDETFTVSIQNGVGATESIVWQAFDEIGLTWSNIPNLPLNSSSINVTTFGSIRAEVFNSNGCSTQTNVVSILQDCPSVTCQVVPDPLVSGVVIELTGCNTGLITISHTYAPNSYEFECSGGGVYNVVQTATSTTAQVTFNRVGEIIVKFKAYYTGVNGDVCELETIGTVLVPYRADLKYTATCGTNSTYTVNLLNHSEVYPGYTINAYSYFYNNSWHDNFSNPNTTITLPPGNHLVKIRISDGVNAPCEKGMIVSLPAFPIATFTVANTACPNTPLQFNANAIDIANGCLFSWDFGDFSFNNLPNPEKSYPSGPRNVSLTVTNTQGCSVVSASTNINIFNVSLSGALNVTPSSYICEGTPVDLEFFPSNNVNPNTYEWYGNQSPQVLSNTPVFSPTLSGLYGLKVYDDNGCFKWIEDWISITFIKAPIAQINGPTAVCVNTDFQLEGYVGGDTLYEWYYGGNLVSTDSFVNLHFDTPGVYEYMLTVRAADGMGGYCSNTDEHIVTVFEAPQPPVISIVNDEIICDSYQIPLHVESVNNEPGHFSWSNGMQGSDVVVTQGGPYLVRYTDDKGCTVSSQIDIPKAPSYFNWVFPRGCYTICRNPLRQIIGPLEQMPYWGWLIDQTVQVEGVETVVEPIEVVTDGAYQFTLNTGLCTETTEPANFTVQFCKHCPIEHELKLIDKIDYNGSICYFIEFKFSNNTPEDIWLNIQPGTGFGGSFIPNTILLVANAVNVAYSFIYVPAPGYTGGNFEIHFTEESKCSSFTNIELPDISEYSKTNASVTKEKVITFLHAAPNPVTDATTFYYSLENSALSKQILVYDLTGRAVAVYGISDVQGKLSVDLTHLPMGYYTVVLEADGKIVANTKILRK